MPTTPFASYVICTSPRSGSTLLCGLLAATGVAGRPASHFHAPSLGRWLDVYGLADLPFASRCDALRAVFDAARERGTDGTGMFGLRMQRGSFGYFADVLATLHPDHPNDARRIEAEFGHTLFVHLTRSDKLDQAISRVRAEQTGLWHRNADGTELERLAPLRQIVDARDGFLDATSDEQEALHLHLRWPLSAERPCAARYNAERVRLTLDGVLEDAFGAIRARLMAADRLERRAA